MIPAIDDKTCTGCGNCVDICPPGAILLKDGKAYIADDLCEECGFCAPECPVEAIGIPFPTKE